MSMAEPSIRLSSVARPAQLVSRLQQRQLKVGAVGD